MKIASIIGTRPNFTKEFAINEICRQKDIKEILIHTGQHYDYEMSQLFFQELNIPRPDFINSIIKGPQGYETATMLAFIEQVLMQERVDVTIVYGDVNSSLAGALASVKLRIPVVHIEAGLRTNDFYNSEEINRRVTDACSELLFPHIQSAYNSLIREGYDRDRVFLFGDIVKDSLLKIIEQKKIVVTRDNYILCTIHRAENTDSPERMTKIINALLKSDKTIIFPVHPRTMDSLKRYGLYEQISKNSNIVLLPPQGFLDFIRLLAGCNKIITDSGSARREAYILGKPIIVPINLIWVPEMVECGWSRITDAEEQAILEAIYKHNPSNANRPEIFGDGHAAEKIITKIMERFG
ncbi:MAG: UDP-N-acetylglucosamine 2-epimerase (non-hydrolyzing) [Candidatus Hydrogenedentota bacterium]